MQNVREEKETQIVNLLRAFAAAKRFYQAKRDWLGDGGEVVPRSQAQRRADVCKTCPKNVDKPLWGFLTTFEITSLSLQLRVKDDLGLKLDGEDRLHICDVCDCNLKLKPWQPLTYALASSPPLDEFPAHCWMVSDKTP